MLTRRADNLESLHWRLGSNILGLSHSTLVPSSCENRCLYSMLIGLLIVYREKLSRWNLGYTNHLLCSKPVLAEVCSDNGSSIDVERVERLAEKALADPLLVFLMFAIQHFCDTFSKWDQLPSATVTVPISFHAAFSQFNVCILHKWTVVMLAFAGFEIRERTQLFANALQVLDFAPRYLLTFNGGERCLSCIRNSRRPEHVRVHFVERWDMNRGQSGWKILTDVSLVCSIGLCFEADRWQRDRVPSCRCSSWSSFQHVDADRSPVAGISPTPP